MRRPSDYCIECHCEQERHEKRDGLCAKCWQRIILPRKEKAAA